jgi:hypothetical protein
MRRGNVITAISCALILCGIFLLGLTGCGGDSGPTPGALAITTTSLPNGTLNRPYSASVSGSGGLAPYTWSVSPALPANLSLDAATGTITGTPNTQGTTAHTFTLRDNSAPSQTVQQTLSLTVGVLTITTTSLPNGTVNVAYSQTLQATGGIGTLTWNIVAGAGTLPPGLNLNQSTGVISGTPTVVGTSSFTVRVADSEGQSDTQALSIQITANSRHLTVMKSGNGTVSSSPSGISCGTTCESDFAINSIVTLTAAPAAGSTFTGWSGAGCSGTGACAVAMNADQTVTASFATPNTFTLTASKAGVGLGTVTSSPPGINCGATCSFNFASGTTVTLTATPGAGSTFAGWSGSGCSGTATCVVVMSQNRSVTATFNAVPSVLTLTKAGAGTGSVTSSPSGINCGNGCSTDNGTFPTNSSVTLTANAASGSVFAGWSGGGCSGTGTCTTVMATNQTVSAQFDLVPVVTLTVTKQGTGDGTVTSDPAGISCGPGCNTSQASYQRGTTVTLTATPDGDSRFDDWHGGPCDNSSSPTCQLQMNNDVTTSAHFRD